MQIPALQRNVAADDLPLEKLAANREVSEEEKIAAASRQFEAILLRQILHTAQKPMFKSNLFPQSVTSGIYQDMVTHQLAEDISRSGALGLGDSIKAELSRQLLAHEKDEEKPAHPASEDKKP